MRSRPALIATAGAGALVLAARAGGSLPLARLALAGATLGAAVAPSTLGMRDIKLMLVVALGVEQDAIRALTLALLIAVIAAPALLISKGPQARHRSLPLAPLLATGTLLAVL